MMKNIIDLIFEKKKSGRKKFSLKDAKPGDILVKDLKGIFQKPMICIFKEIDNKDMQTAFTYVLLSACDEEDERKPSIFINSIDLSDCRKASEKQKNELFDILMKYKYNWDSEKIQLTIL